jgi:hypothetical protein
MLALTGDAAIRAILDGKAIITAKNMIISVLRLIDSCKCPLNRSS